MAKRERKMEEGRQVKKRKKDEDKLSNGANHGKRDGGKVDDDNSDMYNGKSKHRKQNVIQGKQEEKQQREEQGQQQRRDGGFGGARWKEKVLLLCSRGTTYRFRHLLNDVVRLIPHCKLSSKLDTKSDRRAVNEMAEMKGCTSSLLFEVRKHRDLYMWMAKIPDGPSMKFHVTNVHTMDELKLTGNHMRGTRSLLSFSQEFGDDEDEHNDENGLRKNGSGNSEVDGDGAHGNAHLRLMKELFIHIFGVPRGHRKSKPFYDHVISFSVIDNRILIRNYQIIIPGAEQRTGKASLDDMSLAEVGPRMCLNPVKIFTGSHSGASIYSNPSFMTPTAMRIAAKKEMNEKYSARVASKQSREKYVDDVVGDVQGVLKTDAFKNVFKMKDKGKAVGNDDSYEDDENFDDVIDEYDDDDDEDEDEDEDDA